MFVNKLITTYNSFCWNFRSYKFFFGTNNAYRYFLKESFPWY